MKTKIILVANHKGGVGKTSSVAALGDVLSRNIGKKVLLIDADPQANLSRRFGYGISASINTTLDVLLYSIYEHRKSNTSPLLSPSLFFNEAFLKLSTSNMDARYEQLHIICCTNELHGIFETFHDNTNVAGEIVRELLSDIKKMEEFDYVLIDTSPSFSYASIFMQFLLGSDYIMVPLKPSEDSFAGAKHVINAFNIASKEEKINKANKIRFLGLFFCGINDKSITDREYRNQKESLWGESLFFETSIVRSNAVINAENIGAPVTAMYPKSAASSGYKKLAREIETRIGDFKEDIRQ